MTTPETPPPGRAQRGNRFALPNGAYRGLLAAMGAIFVGLVAWFIISMIVQARPAFSTLGFSWIIQKTWDPTHNKYGLLPFILGTVETTAIAMVLALPIGLGTALALAYLVPHRVRQGLSSALGETVAVALVIGNSPYIAHSVKSTASTLPALIVNNFGEATGTELSALFGAGLVLLLIGVTVNAVARVLVRSAARSGAASVAVA